MSKSKQSFKPSKSVRSNYSPSKNVGLKFKITGRAPTVLTYENNSPQGDHVTAHRLVEEGLYRSLGDLESSEVEDLFKLENRVSLRDRRSKLYNYISAIAILDPSRKDEFYAAVDKTLNTYNNTRYSKREIKETAEKLHSDPSVTGVSYNQSLEGLEAKFRKNGEKVREMFNILSSMVMTFYNRVTLTAYHNIPDFTEAGGNIKAITKSMDTIIEWIKKNQVNPISSSALTVKRSQVVNAINPVIHYPEITDEKALTLHITENIDKKGRFNKPRNNDKNTLIELLSRHVHVFFAVYPEIKQTFNQQGELVDDFVDKFIGQGTPKPNWPKFANDANVQEIKNGVKINLATLSESFANNHYNRWKEGKDLDSSDDEDIPTKPRVKVIPQVAKTLNNVRTEAQEKEIEGLRKELQELRMIKEIIEENRDNIPSEIMDEIDNISSPKKKAPTIRSHSR